METSSASRSQNETPIPVVDAALNDIRVEIGGGKVRMSAVLDIEGLAKLRRKLDALEMLIGDDEES